MSARARRPALRAAVALLCSGLTACAATHEIRVQSNVEGARGRVHLHYDDRGSEVSATQVLPADFRLRWSPDGARRKAGLGLLIGGGVIVGVGAIAAPVSAAVIDANGGIGTLGAAIYGGGIAAVGVIIALVGTGLLATSKPPPSSLELQVGAPGHTSSRRLLDVSLVEDGLPVIRLDPEPSPTPSSAPEE